MINAMVLDPHGNRFISLTSGVLGRIGNEAVSGPVITDSPAPQTTLAGSNVVFSVGASASDPIRYFWRFNGQFMTNQTNAVLTLNNISLSQAGNYSVIVSNFAGSVTKRHGAAASETSGAVFGQSAADEWHVYFC